MKTVMLFGTFDIVHIGHLHIFARAKEYGDKLVVVVARDVNVEKYKGIEPLHNEQERKYFLQNIKGIDRVILGRKNDPYKIIDQVRPDIVCLGYDQKIYVDNLAKAITDYGLTIRVVKLKPYQKDRFKSSKIRKYIQRLM